MTSCAATTIECGEVCEVTVREWFHANVDYPTEIHISTEPSLVESQHPPIVMRCPHGVRWYLVPTSEQIAAWAEAGVE